MAYQTRLSEEGSELSEKIGQLKMQEQETNMNLRIWSLLVILSFLVIGCSKKHPTEGSSDTNDITTVNRKGTRSQYAACVTCYIGKIGSSSNCSVNICEPSEKTNNVELTQKLSCGHPNEVSDIEWNFIEHEDGKDLYSFKRTFPANKNESTTSSKIVSFDGSQVVIFQDEYQVIVIDTPNEE